MKKLIPAILVVTVLATTLAIQQMENTFNGPGKMKLPMPWSGKVFFTF